MKDGFRKVCLGVAAVMALAVLLSIGNALFGWKLGVGAKGSSDAVPLPDDAFGIIVLLIITVFFAAVGFLVGSGVSTKYKALISVGILGVAGFFIYREATSGYHDPSPLEVATRAQDKAEMAEILAKGTYDDWAIKLSWERAVKDDFRPGMQLLVDKVIKIDSCSAFMSTAHEVSLSGVELLLKHGASPSDCRHDYGRIAKDTAKPEAEAFAAKLGSTSSMPAAKPAQ